MAVATRAPATREDLAAVLAEAGEAGTPVRFRGGGTKQAWPPVSSAASPRSGSHGFVPPPTARTGCSKPVSRSAAS